MAGLKLIVFTFVPTASWALCVTSSWPHWLSVPFYPGNSVSTKVQDGVVPGYAALRQNGDVCSATLDALSRSR